MTKSNSEGFYHTPLLKHEPEKNIFPPEMGNTQS